ncbi:MAG TPA: maleylpyruvate isomerase N-terminal domain-containing protein [Mycobacteriales bacterium]|jgi:uncharacterized protein (TIGR03083 family)|nr:maleylpyruvate isomerase N-terminal domain-containing protein [Mycobacteriales bacterium]
MTDDGETFGDWLAALHASHDRLTEVVTPLSATQVEAPSYPTEWSIAQVLSHLGSGAEIFSLMLEAGLANRPAPESEAFQQIWAAWDAKSAADQAADGLRADADFLDRLDGLDADQVRNWQMEMFGGDQRLPDLLRFRLGEHAVHTWDIEVAGEPAATIAQPSVELLIDNLDQLVARSGRPPADPLRVHVETAEPIRVFRLHSTSDGVLLEVHGIETPADDNAALRLPAEAFIRLVYGRLDPLHTPPLATDGVDLDGLRATFPGF